LIKKLFGYILVPLAWTVLMQVLFCLPGSSLPDVDKFSIPNLDKYVHIFLFGVFVALWCYYFYGKGKSPKILKTIFFGVYLVAVFNGVLMEYIQLYYISGRSFDKGDIIADMMGASLAYGLSNIKLLKTSL